MTKHDAAAKFVLNQLDKFEENGVPSAFNNYFPMEEHWFNLKTDCNKGYVAIFDILLAEKLVLNDVKVETPKEEVSVDQVTAGY
mgnify:CR=1 FL=1